MITIKKTMKKIYFGLDLSHEQLKEYEAIGCFFNNLESARKYLAHFPLTMTEIFEVINEDEPYGYVVL